MSDSTRISYSGSRPQYLARYRRRRERQAELRRRGIETRKCFYCKQPGHLIGVCGIKERNEGAQLIRDAINTGISYYPEKSFGNGEDYILQGSDIGLWKNLWYVSPNLQNHIAGNLDFFLKLKRSFGVESKIRNEFVFIRGVGIVSITVEDQQLVIPNVFYSTDLEDNILSLPQLLLQGFVVKIVGNFCVVENMFKDKSMQFRFIENTSESKEEISAMLEIGEEEHNKMKSNYINDYYESISAEADCTMKQVDDVVNSINIDSLEKCIELLDIIHDMEFPWAHRNILKGPFVQMVSWFLKEFLGIMNRPIPPRFENGKYVELYDLYIMVQREGGYRRVSTYDIWVVIAKELGFDYEDKDMMRVLYAQYLDVLDWQYLVHKNARKTAAKEMNERHESSQVRRVNTSPNMSMEATSSNKEMKPNEEDFALYMGGDWRAAKRYMKRRNFDFTQAEIALKEAIETLPTSPMSPSYI